ncbi:ABC transporter permease [Spiroplasma helicoides]|uniref:ABC transporter permease n=1 Tax=Spiroplasma helicoides TaxID=216938 RepID=A0A1B3SLA2_9MOLU|nr:ABC transporter permease [Spiroplasma helicoides]AOG60716.1 ABC transporter permease [Spiroplasma helicoides]
MKNIFKSYLKLFAKSWVETLGSILFLAIFTMVVMGMLATPLQLSLKANSLKNQTNLWDNQMQYSYSYSDEFLGSTIYEGKEFAINYEGEKIQVVKNYDGTNNQGVSGWLTPKMKQIADDYSENWLNYNEKITGKKYSEAEKEQNHKKIRNNLMSSLAFNYKRNGLDVELKIKIDPESEGGSGSGSEIGGSESESGSESSNNGLNQARIYPIDSIRESNLSYDFKDGKLYEQEGGYAKFLTKEIFRQDLQGEISQNNALQDIQSFVANKVLEKVGNKEDKFRYSSFQSLNTVISQKDVIYNYLIQAYNPIQTSAIDDNLNNLIISKSIKSAPDEVSKDSTLVEAYVNDLFLAEHNIKLGDVFSVPIPIANSNYVNFRFKVMGIANKYSTIAPLGLSFLGSTKNYAQIFVDKSFFYEDVLYSNNFLTKNFKFKNNIAIYQDKMAKNSKYDLNSYFVSNSITNYNGLVRAGLSVFSDFSDHRQITQLTNLKIMTYIFAVIGGILLGLAFFFITFVLKKEINSTRKQLGVFKSLGYKTRELTGIFSIKTFLTMTLAISIGYVLSIPLQIKASTDVYPDLVIFKYDQIYSNPYFLVFLIIFVPLIFSGISYFVIYLYLNEGALQLMNDGAKKSKIKWLPYLVYFVFPPALIYTGLNLLILKSLKKSQKGFTYRMQETFVSFGRGKFILIMILVGLSSFLFTMQMRAMPVINGMINGAFNQYNDDLNHYYRYNKLSRLNYSNKITLNSSSDVPKINYIDTSESKTTNDFIKEYGSNYFNKYDQISNLMNKVVEYRDNVVKRPELNEFKKFLPIVFNTVSLFYPLSDEYLKNFENNLNSLMVSAAKALAAGDEPGIKDLFNTLDNWASNKDNLYHIKNDYENNKNNGIWLSDVAKYICVSTESSFDSCSDTSEYQKYLLDTYVDGNKNSNNEPPSDVKNFDSFMNNVLQSFIGELAIKDFTKSDQFIASNTVLFNKKTEILQHRVPYFINGNGDVNVEKSSIVATDFSNDYGDLQNVYKVSGLSKSDIVKLQDETNDYANVVITSRLAKILNCSVGNTFNISIGQDGLINQTVKVAVINSNDTFNQTIFIDYKYLFNKYGSNLPKDEMFFNQLYSKEESLEGSFNIKDIKNIKASTFKNKLEKSSILTSTGKDAKEWIGPILDLYFKNIDAIINEQTVQIPDNLKNLLKDFKTKHVVAADNKVNYFMNANVIGGSLTVIPLLKAAINAVMSEMTNSMLMYILIDILLLVILLIVIMNIIIKDSVNIITIMRSMGYNDVQTNWMVIGRYITGAILTFIVSYLLSIGAWMLIQFIVWDKFKMLINIPWIWYIPVVSFVVIAGIMFIGWLTAMKQIKKQPLTYLVN